MTPTAGRIAIVLPPPGSDAELVAALLHALAGQPTSFEPVTIGPPGHPPVPGWAHRPVTPTWRILGPARRYATAVAAELRRLVPAVIEVHDAPQAAAYLGWWLRPTPVVLVIHTDPQALAGARDAAARTYLLAQATRVAATTPALRARMLVGVHPAMRHCTLLPPPDGPGGPLATADALDALRRDALQAWSRPLRGPI